MRVLMTDWLSAHRSSQEEPTGAQAGRPPKIWQIFPISGSLSRTLSTPWERRPMTCTLRSYKTKIQDKDTGTFWFWPFCSNHVGGGGQESWYILHAIPQKGKDLIAKWESGTVFKFPFILPKKIMYTHCTLYNRSRGKMGGNFKPMFI